MESVWPCLFCLLLSTPQKKLPKIRTQLVYSSENLFHSPNPTILTADLFLPTLPTHDSYAFKKYSRHCTETIKTSVFTLNFHNISKMILMENKIKILK